MRDSLLRHLLVSSHRSQCFYMVSASMPDARDEVESEEFMG